MRPTLFPIFWSFFYILLGRYNVYALTSYANDFVDPDLIVSGGFGGNTQAAQATVMDWANELAAKGPWTVMNKTVTPPTGSKHDYMSWAPYWWPDCSNVGNKTELTPEDIWKTCPYVTRDGLFNPDGRLVNDVGAFQDLGDAVLYNAIAFSLRGEPSSVFSQKAVFFIKTWFLDEETKMNPNLDYAQMKRGPQGQAGSSTGVLDLKGLVKIVSGIIILRKAKCTDWTQDLDGQMNAWSEQYITWLETSITALGEGHADNNHGTFYYNQLAALKILVNDMDGAHNVTNTYFGSQYTSQINASGEQPLEAARTRPYHYRAYNLAAMITNARLAAYTGDSIIWNKTTSGGATIQNALEYAMNIPANASNETPYASELYPSVAAVAAVYGDPSGKYVAFLAQGDPAYASEAYFLWNQPLAGGGGESGAVPATSNGKNAKTSNNERISIIYHSGLGLAIGVVAVACIMVVL